MSPSSSSLCTRCQSPLPDATEGLCARCLMAEAMQPTQADGTAALPPLTPEELTPHFPQLEILECLGRGGMGVVYKARQKSLNRLVALKLLAPERADDPQFAARFEKEAQALAALNHPHIVGVYDFGQAGGFYYLLMEFVDGINLRQLLQTKKLTPKEALSIVPPICDALQCAHDHGIVHRDIKPENLLIDKHGSVKIADFGIAKMMGDERRTKTTEGTERASDEASFESSESFQSFPAAGTPAYAAPEQTTGNADHRADIYSLGVVLYEMLTGERPKEAITPPSKRVQVDIRIDEIVLRALEKTPELRFATAAEFRTQVETALGEDEREDPDDGRAIYSLTSLAWSAVPVVAVALVFFNPWGPKAWTWFAGGCALLAVLPALSPANWSWRRGVSPRALIEKGSASGFGRPSGVQRFVHRWFPAGWFESMKAESQAWHLVCECGHATSVWDRGGIRYGASGNPPKFLSCPACHRTTWHRTEWRGEGGPSNPTKGSGHALAVNAAVWVALSLAGLWVTFFVNVFRHGMSGAAPFMLLAMLLATAPLVFALFCGRWLRASAWTAFILALPCVAISLFFITAMMSETGGWHPNPVEAMVVPLALVGAVLLPALGTYLWHCSDDLGHRSWTSGCVKVLLVLVLLLAAVAITLWLSYSSQQDLVVSEAKARLAAERVIALAAEARARTAPSSPSPQSKKEAHHLEFRWVAAAASVDTEDMTLPGSGDNAPEVLHVEKTVRLDDSDVLSSGFVPVEPDDQPGRVRLRIQFTPEGAKRLALLTREGKNRPLAIVIEGKLHSAPVIHEEIAGGLVELGPFTETEAWALMKSTGRQEVVLQFISARKAREELLKAHPELEPTLGEVDEAANTISLRPSGGPVMESARRELEALDQRPEQVYVQGEISEIVRDAQGASIARVVSRPSVFGLMSKPMVFTYGPQDKSKADVKLTFRLIPTIQHESDGYTRITIAGFVTESSSDQPTTERTTPLATVAANSGVAFDFQHNTHSGRTFKIVLTPRWLPMQNAKPQSSPTTNQR